MTSESANEATTHPESTSDMGGIKNGMYFSGVKTPCLSGGHVNPFSGENSGRIVTDKAELRARTKTSGQVGRVRAIHNRISELERSAITMYTQHAGAAMALEREVAALREERMRLGDDLKDNTAVKPRRPMSAPPSSPGKARKTWMMSTSPKMRQNASSERMSTKPVRRKTIEQSTPSQKRRNDTPPKNSTKQRGAAVRLSKGDQSHPHAWEEFMPQGEVQPQETKPSPKHAQKHPSKSRYETKTGVKSSSKSKQEAKDSFEQFVKESPAPPPNPAHQKAKMKALSSPSVKPREKVVSEGISKGSIDWIQYYAAQIPGPGQYEVDKASKLLVGPSGGRFSKAKPLSHVDILCHDASMKPGPGAYKLKSGADLISGGGFSNAAPLTDVDRLAMEARLKPGPGEYGPLLIDCKGRTMLGRGRTWSKAAPMSDVDRLVLDASRKPGPGAYKLKSGADLISGGAFSTATPLSNVDRLMLDASRKPGPGEYGAPYDPRKDTIGRSGKFSTSRAMSEVDRLTMDAASKPGPGQYGAPKKPVFEKGGSGKFPFVYHPKDPKLAHLAKG